MLFAGTTSESYPNERPKRGVEEKEDLKYSPEAPSRYRDIWTVITLAMPRALISYSRSPIAARIKGLRDKPFRACSPPLTPYLPFSAIIHPQKAHGFIFGTGKQIAPPKSVAEQVNSCGEINDLSVINKLNQCYAYIFILHGCLSFSLSLFSYTKN